MKKGMAKVSRYVLAYVCLVLTSQVQIKSSVVGDSASAVDAPQVFQRTFNALINEN